MQLYGQARGRAAEAVPVASRAVEALTVGYGPDHALTRQAVVFADSLRMD